MLASKHGCFCCPLNAAI